MKVLLFGGTSEGRELALMLAEAGVDVCVSVASEAGVKALPSDVDGLTVICGSLSHEEKVSLFEQYDFVVDATHPFAQSISPHIAAAAEEAAVKLLRVVRPPSDTEGCLLAADLAEAIALIGDEGAVLATTGSKNVGEYSVIADFKQRLFARVLDDDTSVALCRQAGLDDEHIIAKRGPFSVEDNLGDIARYNIRTLVTKDSGVSGGFPEKVEACRRASIDCIVITRPVEDGILLDEAFTLITGKGANQ